MSDTSNINPAADTTVASTTASTTEQAPEQKDVTPEGAVVQAEGAPAPEKPADPGQTATEQAAQVDPALNPEGTGQPVGDPSASPAAEASAPPAEQDATPPAADVQAEQPPVAEPPAPGEPIDQIVADEQPGLANDPAAPMEVQEVPEGPLAEALDKGYWGERQDPNPPEAYTAEHQAAVARGEQEQVPRSPEQPVLADSASDGQK